VRGRWELVSDLDSHAVLNWYREVVDFLLGR